MQLVSRAAGIGWPARAGIPTPPSPDRRRMVMGILQNKVAIITGASSGIGRAAALLFAAEGACVILNARGAAALAEVADLIAAQGGKAFAVAGDVGTAETHRALVGEAQKRFGGLDIAFNNAGTVGAAKPVGELDPTTGTRPSGPTSPPPFSPADTRSPPCWNAAAAQSSSLPALSEPASGCREWPPMRCKSGSDGSRERHRGGLRRS